MENCKNWYTCHQKLLINTKGAWVQLVQSIMVTKILLVGFVLFIQKASYQAQAPPFRKIGCPVNRPAPPSDLQSSNYCFYQNTTCVPTKNDWPYQFDNRHRGSIYRKIRTRSWWFCGKACDPTTPCMYWTYRPKTRECYLMKSCCPSNVAGYQSGLVGCPEE